MRCPECHRTIERYDTDGNGRLVIIPVRCACPDPTTEGDVPKSTMTPEQRAEIRAWIREQREARPDLRAFEAEREARKKFGLRIATGTWYKSYWYHPDAQPQKMAATTERVRDEAPEPETSPAMNGRHTAPKAAQPAPEPAPAPAPTPVEQPAGELLETTEVPIVSVTDVGGGRFRVYVDYETDLAAAMWVAQAAAEAITGSAGGGADR